MLTFDIFSQRQWGFQWQEYKVKMYLRMRWEDPRLAFGDKFDRDVINVDASLYGEVSQCCIFSLSFAHCFAHWLPKK